MGYQAAPDGSLVFPCGLYQLMSKFNTEGTGLLFESKWLLYPAFGFPPTPSPSIRPPTPPTPPTPPPIDSIRHITGTEKLSEKPAAFKLVASRISHEIIVPHEKYSALNIEIQIAWRWSVFPKMVTYIYSFVGCGNVDLGLLLSKVLQVISKSKGASLYKNSFCCD